MSRVGYVVFTSGAVSGTGVLTRAEAMAKAFTARHTEGVEFQIFGTVDRAAIPDWLTNVKAAKYLFDSNQILIDALTAYKPDIILVDSYPGNLVRSLNNPIGYLDTPDRPPNVWGIMRHTPGALGKYRLEDSLRGMFDRLYQIEPSNHGLNTWDISLTRERTRSIAQREANTKDVNYQEPPPKDTSEFDRWAEHYKRHLPGSRKLIAPIVNVEPDRILPRLEARKALLEFAELDPKEAESNKPLALVAMVAGRTVGDEFVQSRKWQGQLFKQWGLYDLPENERLFVQVMPNAPKIPELWRYLAGVDYFIGSCGYNTFYEVRYVKALGLFNGKAAFWPMANYADQQWRADNQARLFSGELYPHGLNPVENGAAYIVDTILRKLGN